MRDKAILIVSCSDARMAVDSRVESWSRQLDFDGAIYEVRLPGGALAIADRASPFSQSILESYAMLSGTRQISAIILSCHEDCSYFRLKYYPSGVSSSEEREAQKRFMRHAEEIVSEFAPGVPVQQIYSKFKSSGDVEHSPIYSDDRRDGLTPRRDFRRAPTPQSAYAPQRPMAPMASTASMASMASAPHVCGPQVNVINNNAWGAPPPPPPQRLSPAGERLTARQLQNELERRIFSGDTAEQSMVDATSTAEERRIVPAWRVERRLREFLELVRANQAVSSDAELQRLSLNFTNRYGGQRLPRQTARDVVSEAKADLGDLKSWRKERRKAS